MGAGKSTLGPALAARLGRPFVSVDDVVEKRAGSNVADLFEARGESVFRALEEEAALDVLARRPLSVIELGGGGLGSAATRTLLAESAFTLHLETTPDEAWERVAASGRPLARDQDAFRGLFEERRALYEAANGSARDLDGAVLAAAGVHISAGALDHLGELVPGAGAVELVADEHVESLYGERARIALGARLAGSHSVPAGERAKTATEAGRLWSALRLGRNGMIVALGGGSTIDLGGFVAATYLRGVSWVSAPTTLLAQVDAGIGGKTAIDLAQGKNLVGAFHWPARTVIDPEVLSTLPATEIENGRAEVVKTGLLAGEPLWELETSRAGSPVCGFQGRGLPPRSTRPRRAGAAQPRAHVRARARGRIRVLNVPRACRRARAPRRTPGLGPGGRRAAGRGDSAPRSGYGRPRRRVGCGRP